MGPNGVLEPGSGAEPNARSGPVAAIAVRVRDGSSGPVREVDAALARIEAGNAELYAFDVVRAERARAEAAELEQRPDLGSLPLAGVPIAVKHNIPVTGETDRDGSLAADPVPADHDHPVVRRLRDAGAVIVGLTPLPELGLWGMTDNPGGITRNPWNRALSAGGSSGGSAAAVAAGLVPVAHGNDGLGSVRIPAACCGLFGIKPGRGTVPAEVGFDSWQGMVDNGVLATTVGDAALTLSVLADRPELADISPPPSLRIALSVAPPIRLLRTDRHWSGAARSAGSLATAAGHRVTPAELPYRDAAAAILLRWPALGIPEADHLPNPQRLQPRTRRHLALGRVLRRLGLVRPGQVERVEARLLEFFTGYDVVITPTLAAPPPKAVNWHTRGWLANVVASSSYAPFTALWNLVGWPAVSVPMGMHPRSRTPVAAQLAGPPGSESTLLRLAAQLESKHPWQRTAVPDDAWSAAAPDRPTSG